jgi:hypothetical protein
MLGPRIITIVCRGGNDFDVFEGERFCNRLCWDEMLGQLAELTHPKLDHSYGMKTANEHVDRMMQHSERMAALNKEDLAR